VLQSMMPITSCIHRPGLFLTRRLDCLKKYAYPMHASTRTVATCQWFSYHT
jgi:hypothetical protein